MRKRLWFHKKEDSNFIKGFHLSKDILEAPSLYEESWYFRAIIKIIAPFVFYFLHDKDLILTYK